MALADEIRAGHLRALLVAGGSPLTAFPDPTATRAALASLDVLAVLDVVATPLTELATHVLPVTAQLERADLSMLENVAFRNGTAHTRAVVEPAAERRPAWWALAQIGRRLGLDALGRGRDPDALGDDDVLRGLARGARHPFDDLVAGGPHGSTSDPRVGWVHDSVLPDGRWRLTPDVLLERLGTIAIGDPAPPPLVLVPRRQVRSMNATAYGTADPAQVHLNPADAEQAGVADGNRVRVASPNGAIEGSARHDPSIARGTVSLTHGRAELAANGLVSATTDIDPLTGMPLASGTAVSIEPGAATPVSGSERSA